MHYELSAMHLRGVVPVLLTPFSADESIDENSLRNAVDFAIDSGARGLCALAFASEYYKLSSSEQRRIAKVVIEHTAGRVPVFISIGTAAVHTTVEFACEAETLGADGLMVAAPRVVPLGRKELILFFEGVFRNVHLPVILQDTDFTGAGLPADMFADLAMRCQNLRYAKLENSLAGGKCTDIIRLSDKKVDVLFGMGGIALFDGLEHGACGVMPGIALADIFARIFELHWAERTFEAKALFARIVPYLSFALQHLELAWQMQKRVLKRRGILASDCVRQPTLQLDDKYQARMEEVVDLVIGVSKEISKAHA
jgi:dihydrodipicolinate synthase/N-acetylneuraminate lyase